MLPFNKSFRKSLIPSIDGFNFLLLISSLALMIFSRATLLYNPIFRNPFGFKIQLDLIVPY